MAKKKKFGTQNLYLNGDDALQTHKFHAVRQPYEPLQQNKHRLNEQTNMSIDIFYHSNK